MKFSIFKKQHAKEEKVYSFHLKNIITSGNFFPTNENVFTEKLAQLRAILQPQMNHQTDALICGKYPDWSLVEKAQDQGIDIIFVDNTAEFFSRLLHNPHKESEEENFSTRVPLGV